MPTWTKKKKIVVWILVGVLVTYTLAGFAVAPMVIRHILEKTVSRALNRQVAVNSVRVNPYTLSVTLNALSISDDLTGHLLCLGQCKVNAQLSSIFRWALVLKSVTLRAPDIRIVRTAADAFNFSDLAEAGTAPQASPEPAKPLRVVLDQLHIMDGRVQFEDRTLPSPFSTTISPLNVTLTALDTAPQSTAAAFEFSTGTEAAETVGLKGQFTPVPLAASVQIDVRAIDLDKYAPYYQPYWNAKITKGRLDLSATAHWTAEEAWVKEAALKLADLEIHHADDDAPLLSIPDFQVLNTRIDLQDKSVELGRVNSQHATIRVNREADGRLNWATALRAESSGTPPETSVQTTGMENEDADAAATSPAGSGWTVFLSEMAMDDYRVEFTDRQPASPVEFYLDKLSLSAQSLSTRMEEKGQVSLSLDWNDQGAVEIAGSLGLIPLQGALTVSAEDMDIRPLQPYISEYAGLVITSGRFNTRGDLNLKIPAGASPELAFSGQASLVDFKSVDTDQNADFFNFRSLFLNGLKLATPPLSLSIDEVALTDFYNKVLIAADGTSNIGTIFKTEEKTKNTPTDSETATTRETAEADPGTESTPAATTFGIKTVTLQGGSVDFTDLNVKPSVHLPMKMLGGRISGLDAIEENKADVLLAGKVRGNVPLKISGKINPLIKPPFVDISLNLTSVDLSPFTPYAEKYLGYELTKGLLAMDLTYLVEDNKLKGQNKAVLTQLTLGDSVPSPSATKLPIKLAIALLKDRNGNIDIDLPVQGDLNDPEFSIGGIVLKMLGNLVLDIVTSPFNMLGALFGGGETLSHVDFEPGLAEISAENQARLDNLSKALFERPGLNLEIQGQVDPEGDTAGLRIIQFEQQLKAAKLKAMMARGKQAVPLEQITIDAEEKEPLIRQAYKAATFPKPRDAKGRKKKLSAEEMEKILYTAIEINNDDLRQLAHQRALATKSYLMDAGSIEAQRLFVIEPETDGVANGAAEKSRVQFSLK